MPTTTVDSALLAYREVNRVQAIEPEVNVSHKLDEDSTFNFGITANSLTGATPLGAVPSTLPQRNVRPYKVIPLGTPVTVTSASGGSTAVLPIRKNTTVAAKLALLRGAGTEEFLKIEKVRAWCVR